MAGSKGAGSPSGVSPTGTGHAKTATSRPWAGFSRPGWRLLLAAGLIVAIVAANTAGQIRLNRWQGAFFDAIGQRNYPAFIEQLKVFAALVAILLVLVVAQTWLSERLKVRLRDWITRDLLDAWLMPRRPYDLRLKGPVGAHPDQRIHEDARHLSELGTDLGLGLLQSSLLLVSFVGVLWSLSASMRIAVAGHDIVVPGFMVWCALAYSLVGSLLTWIVGRPLIRLNAERYEREGAFRFALVRIDEGAQGIVLHREEAGERAAAGASFDVLQRTARRLADALAQLTWITSAYGWGTLVAPVIAAMPAYFSGSLTLGDLMMVIGAFGQVQQALRWFVDNFPRIADAGATLRRVVALRQALDSLDGADGEGIEVVESGHDRLVVEGLRLALPRGTSQLDVDPLTVERGQRILVAGEPGCGKSTFFLALAGLWRNGQGRIAMPPASSTLFLPQIPYLPEGTLRDALAAGAGSVADAEIETALDRVGLAHLRRELGRSARWDRELTLDEQQGVQLASVLLHKPGWIIMDEALSAFDESRRMSLLALLLQDLPGSTVVTTGRLNEPDGFWTRVLHLTCSAGPLPQRPAAALAPRLDRPCMPRPVGEENEA
ncbi:MAG: ABC transporter ATP-binding protein/permease [Alsobacter sp.]